MNALRCVFPAFGCLLLLGPALAQTVAVHVGRSERPAVIGLDEQLAALPVTKGSLQVSAGADAKSPPADAQFSIEVAWVAPTKDAPKGFRPAAVSSSDAARARRWLDAALAKEGAFGEVGEVGEVAAETAAAGAKTGLRLRIEFPEPKTGLSKARQFRHVRQVVAVALQDLGMLAELPKPWPARFPKEPAICLYDAEGVGGSGCENIERAVDETTLRGRLLAICPEDIREGGLRGMAAVVFPGGSGGGIAKALQAEGVAAVRSFVGDGGGYVGICAGAYFAGAGLASYAALMPWHHTQPWAKGAAQLDVELTDDGKRLLGAEFAKFRTRYNNGPVYPDVLAQSRKAAAKSKPLVLANFASPAKDKKGVVHEAMVGTPAIAADTFGKGRVLIISPHPESHRELNALVARAIGWTLSQDPGKVSAK